MTGTVTKGLIQRQDVDNYDGELMTSRIDSTGGTLAGLKVGNEVDILSVYGDGDTSNQTLATINDAIVVLGASNIALLFAPGTWAITDDITIASNFTVVVPAGCVFDVSAGKTLTIAGVLFRYHDTYSSGSGTVTISGTDLIPTTDYGRGYAADTGTADAYVAAPSPAITSYTVGEMFRFKAANANTGVSTLNVNGRGVKTIKKDVSTDLAANDIVADQIVTVLYDGTNFQAIPTVFATASPATLVTDNVYTKTETWGKGADVLSASNLLINIDGNLFDITATNQIDTLATKGVGTLVVLQFDGALTLAHDSANLILPGAANITTAAGDIAVFYEYASADWRCVSYQKATQAPGEQHIVQRVHTVDSAVATSTTIMPIDDTIPESGEGGQFLTLAITPKNTSNRLLVEVNINISSTNAGYDMAVALFQDATADALAVAIDTSPSASLMSNIQINHEMAAGTVSATTFKVRAGIAGAGTTTLNGKAGVRLMGGVMSSTITITEIAP